MNCQYRALIMQINPHVTVLNYTFQVMQLTTLYKLFNGSCHENEHIRHANEIIGGRGQKPRQIVLKIGLPCCFFLALSQMAGRRWTCSPESRMQRFEHTKTPRQDFFRICTL